MIGGERRRDHASRSIPSGCAGYGVSALAIAQSLRQTTGAFRPGPSREANREVLLSAGRVPQDVEDVRQVVVGVRDGRPLRLGEVAEVRDGPAERSELRPLRRRPERAREGDRGRPRRTLPAVTIAIAKKRGSNAVVLADADRARRSTELKRTLDPDRRRGDPHARLRRDGGGEVERADQPRADRHRRRRPPDALRPRPARGARRGRGRAGDARPDARGELRSWATR